MVRWHKRRLLFLRQNTKSDPIFWRHSRSRSRSFPGITTSHSRSQKLGMEFVIPVPVPKNWEWNLSFPFPFPKVGNAIFHSRSRSQNLGMGWAIPVPVPKVKKPFPLTPVIDPYLICLFNSWRPRLQTLWRTHTIDMASGHWPLKML